MSWFITRRLPLVKWMSSETHKAVYSTHTHTPTLPICSVYPYGFNFSRHWATLAMAEEKMFSNASTPQCKVYVPGGKQHSTLLLECSTVKESVWDLAPRFKDMETLSRWTDQNTQTWRPYCATTAFSVDPVHGDPQGAKGRHPQKQATQKTVSGCSVILHRNARGGGSPRGCQGRGPGLTTQSTDS